MTNSRSSNAFTIIGKHTTVGTESDHTFTFSAIDFDTDSYLLLAIDISPTLVQSLRMQYNANTNSTYHTDGTQIAGGTENLIDLSSEASWQLISTTVLAGVNAAASAIVTIQLTKAGSQNRVLIHTNCNEAGSGTEMTSGTNVDAASSITSLKLFSSTSTWQAGTRFTLYRVRR